MSEADGQTDAAKRAAARRAKILARGNTGLQKLAQTARGEEAEKLYGGDSASSSRPATPSVSSPSSAPKSNSASGPSWIPPSSESTSTSTASNRQNPVSHSRSNASMSPEEQQAQDQFRAMMAMLGGGGGDSDAGGPQGGMPDMSQLFAQMMGGQQPGGLGGFGGAGGQNLLGDLDDPAGLGGRPEGMPNFPDLSQLANFGLGGAAGGPGGNGNPFGIGMGMAPPKGRSWVEKSYPLIHAISIVALLAFVLGWWEPSIRSARWSGAVTGYRGGGNAFSRWGRMAGRQGGWGKISGLLGGVESLPLFWAFTTLELMLQTTRFFILKSPPPPHSLISTFLPMLPPGIARPLLTGSRYLSMLSQIYKDGCLLIFGLGVFVIISEYVSAQ